MDSQLTNFWVENINKEAAVRFNWYLKYSKKFAAAASRNATAPAKGGGRGIAIEKPSSICSSMEKPISSLTQAGQTPGNILPDEKAANKSTSEDMLVMRKVSAHTRSLLYNGISAHGEGRYAYLAKRKLKAPDEKYNYPILSSSLYGWKIVDYGIPKTSAYARTSVVKDSFYRRSGIIIG